jgi:hypothetical protein
LDNADNDEEHHKGIDELDALGSVVDIVAPESRNDLTPLHVPPGVAFLGEDHRLGLLNLNLRLRLRDRASGDGGLGDARNRGDFANVFLGHDEELEKPLVWVWFDRSMRAGQSCRYREDLVMVDSWCWWFWLV